MSRECIVNDKVTYSVGAEAAIAARCDMLPHKAVFSLGCVNHAGLQKSCCLNESQQACGKCSMVSCKWHVLRHSAFVVVFCQAEGACKLTSDASDCIHAAQA